VTYEIALEYRCGCRDSWQVSTPPPPDDVMHRSPEVCLAESCGTCQARGRPCPDREALARYKPATFTEIAPVRRLTRRKASA
jgi:hypothetical protein